MNNPLMLAQGNRLLEELLNKVGLKPEVVSSNSKNQVRVTFKLDALLAWLHELEFRNVKEQGTHNGGRWDGSIYLSEIARERREREKNAPPP